MKSIDDISYPDYSLIDMEYYTRPNPYAIRGIFIRPAYVLASRGCPGMCKFCVAPRLRPYFGTGRFRHEDRIIEEIKHLKDTYHIDGVYFLDDYFTCNPAAVTLLCHKLKPLDLLWGCSSRINVPEKLIKTMSESGCIQMDFGVERGSDQSLYDIGKYQTVRQIENTFRLCKKYKIRTFANMLVNV
ncbi:MAG: radical SAM protein, partial [Proteobacteria bacterium]|nr:radical SAM protein [Pseudomonadota bacterium]